jgi:tRNA threonylcarbamoyladenosine biosynthesis protein TsaE
LGTVISRSLEETHALGVKLGRLLEQGDFIGLAGELGAGKTALVRGICEGAGVDPAEVTSPTFTIVQSYLGRVPIHHADLYRLSSADELYATGFFDLEGAALVEWVDRVPLPEQDMLRIDMTVVDAQTREIALKATGPRSQRLVSTRSSTPAP